MNKIYIFSCGGGGREIFRLIQDINKSQHKWQVMGYIDDDDVKKGQIIDGLKVFSRKDVPRSHDSYCIVGIMNPTTKERIINQYIIPNNFKVPTLVHPSINIYNDTLISKGVIIFSGAIISYNVKIKEYVLLSSNSLVGHDSEIGQFSSVMPAATVNGNCKIDKNCILGAGSVIHPGVSIGRNCIIGLGSKVINNIKDNKTLMEMPRRILLDNKENNNL